MRQHENGRLTWGAVKASPEAQLRLLELADLDAELSRLDHRRRGLPEHAELEQLEQRDAQLRGTLATLEAEQGDLKRAQGKACLLYTSPSPRDPKTSRMPSSA